MIVGNAATSSCKISALALFAIMAKVAPFEAVFWICNPTVLIALAFVRIRIGRFVEAAMLIFDPAHDTPAVQVLLEIQIELSVATATRAPAFAPVDTNWSPLVVKAATHRVLRLSLR